MAVFFLSIKFIHEQQSLKFSTPELSWNMISDRFDVNLHQQKFKNNVYGLNIIKFRITSFQSFIQRVSIIQCVR